MSKMSIMSPTSFAVCSKSTLRYILYYWQFVTTLNALKPDSHLLHDIKLKGKQ